jgi:hypothetical protein
MHISIIITKYPKSYIGKNMDTNLNKINRKYMSRLYNTNIIARPSPIIVEHIPSYCLYVDVHMVQPTPTDSEV